VFVKRVDKADFELKRDSLLQLKQVYNLFLSGEK